MQDNKTPDSAEPVRWTVERRIFRLDQLHEEERALKRREQQLSKQLQESRARKVYDHRVMMEKYDVEQCIMFTRERILQAQELYMNTLRSIEKQRV